MATRDKPKMAEAAAEPTAGLSSHSTVSASVSTTAPDMSAPKPMIYYPSEARSTSAYANDGQMAYAQQTHRVTPSGLVGRPNNTATSQAMMPYQNALQNALTIPAENTTSFTKYAISSNGSTAYNNSTRGSNFAKVAESSGACSYCGAKGHSHDVCRKQKRQVGCLKCGVKGHLFHQCGQASGNECLYCLKKGHLVAKCHILQKDMMQCGYCSISGHTEDQCRRKMRESSSRATHARAVVPVVDHLTGRNLPRLVDRGSEINAKAPPLLENYWSIWAHSMRVATTSSGSENTRDTSATNQATGYVLPNMYTKAHDNNAEARRSALKDMTMDGNSHEEPADIDKAAHHHTTTVVAAPVLGRAVNEPTSKRTKVDKGARGVDAYATTKHHHEPAGIIFISYAPRNTIRNKEVQNPDTAVSDDLTDFQRKLMQKRRGEAMRLRRGPGRGHC